MMMLLQGTKLSWMVRLSASMAHYKYPFNFNKEEHKEYIQRVAEAERLLNSAEQQNLIPRRKRRVYDRPKHDLDITDYTAWRLYSPKEGFFKFHPHGSRVLDKIKLQPKWLLHAFGLGMPPLSHSYSALKEFVFEDNNLSRFLLYEYRNTTLYRRNIPGYDYDNQDHIRSALRKIKRIDPQAFWLSEEYFEFRLNGSDYCHHLKFVKWLQEQIQIKKTKPSYDEFIDKKFGTAFCYNKAEDTHRFQPAEPIILKVSPAHFTPPKKNQIIKPPTIELPKKLDEKYRIKEENIKENKVTQIRKVATADEE